MWRVTLGAALTITSTNLITGCANGTPKPPKIGAVASQSGQLAASSGPPYWCDLIPKSALIQISGRRAALQEKRGWWTAGQGICRLEDGQEYDALSLVWEKSDGSDVVTTTLPGNAQYRPTILPAYLGRGFTAKTNDLITYQPYYVISTFHCGAISPWLSISMRDVARGRNYVTDLAELMRVVEKRFGLLHHCHTAG